MFDIFKKPKRTVAKKEYYLGLILKEDGGTAIIMAVDAAAKKIVNLDEKGFKYSSAWERIIEDVDETLFELEEKNKIKVKKVIFFLYSHLVDQKNKEIKKPYKDRIKAVSKELELEPLGFIEYHEAISTYLGSREEVHLTSIIIELDKPSVAVFVYKSGALIFSNTSAKTADLAADLESIFNTIKGDIILPSRMILYDSSTLESESEKIISHRWSDNLFIQIPRVEIMPDHDLKSALIYTVSQQLFEKEESKIIEKTEDEDLGFVVGADIKETMSKTSPDPDPTLIEPEEIVAQEKKTETEEKFITDSPIKTPLSERLTAFYKPIFNKLINLFSRFRVKSKAAPLIILGLFLIISGLYFIAYSLHKADVTVFFKGEREKKQIEVKGIVNGSSDKNILNIQKNEDSTDQEDSIDTTGKKTVGEKAKGEVTIHNWDSADKTFKKNTIFLSSSGIKFSLDSEVKVPAASEVSVGVKQTGKTKATLSAVEIGPDGNIDKNQKLKIEDFSTNVYFAQPTEAFSGGSKKDLQTASKDDLKKLKEKVVEKVKKEEDKILANKAGGAKIIDPLTRIDIIEEKYSKEVGEEGKNVNLKAKAKIVFFTFQDRDMKKIVLVEFADLIPKTHQVLAKDISFKINEAKIKDRDVDLSVAANATSILKIDSDKILSDIAGKDTNKVEDLVKEKYKSAGFEAKVKTPIPFLNSRLPFFKKNISLRVDSL